MKEEGRREKEEGRFIYVDWNPDSKLAKKDVCRGIKKFIRG
jgi:deoxycytidylate deaminase